MERVTLFANVIVPLGVPNLFTYRIPADLTDEAVPGKRVLIQFGKKRIYTGIIRSVHETAPKEYQAKYIETILDDAPIVSEVHLHFWDWIAFYYCCNPGDVMNAALPSGLKLSSTSNIQLNADFNFEEGGGYFSDKEMLLIEALHTTPVLPIEKVTEITGVRVSQTLINKLIKKSAIVVYEEVRDRYKPLLKPFLKLSAPYKEESALKIVLDTLEKKAFKQAEALIAFLSIQQSQEAAVNGWVKKAHLVKKTDAAAVNALVKKTILEEQLFETGRLIFEKSGTVFKMLSDGQQHALRETQAAFADHKPVLLHGVTGSGKTEIYISLIREALAQNKQVLYLVPEIALTTQLITRLRAVFGEQVGVYHSKFSENERVEIWANLIGHETRKEDAGPVRENPDYRIILGARSALFLPFTALGLVIIDEEHDPSFKQQDPAPRYHARDAAIYLASLHKCNIILGTATPSLESYANVQNGKYARVELKSQFVSGSGTEVQVCDIHKFEDSNQMRASLTPPLFEAIRSSLARKQQVILFQNRRGFAPVTVCRKCGFIPHCVQCDVPMIYHKQRQKLVCHYCGYAVTPPATCPACGSAALHYRGMGTEKVEEDIEVLFPDAKIARMDLDSTRSKHAHRQLIDEFETGNIDILIGTQMVTKGLDFSNVEVVGILNADNLLNFPDFRSFERAFQMMTQVRGRAGRAGKGHVFIQTTRPDHPVIKHVTDRSIDDFYRELLNERQQFFYPPFSRLFSLTVMSRDANEVNHLSQELFNLLKPHFGAHLLGPEFPPVSKIRNDYHKRLLVKVARTINATTPRAQILNAINTLHNNFKSWKFRVVINVDPA
jgi:primosomal protein N' (replication factor Y) (superfamily II helicase)